MIRYISTILAVICIYCITVLIPNEIKVKLRMLSVNSMYIYILHFFFLRSYVDSSIGNIMIQSIAGVIVPLGVAWLVKKNNLKRIGLLFGD